MGFAADYTNARSQANQLSHQGRLLSIQADARRNHATAQAAAIDSAARLQQDIAAQNMRAASGNRRQSLERVRAMHELTGFSDEGTGSAHEASTAATLDAELANMSQSASIASLNAKQQALDLERQADLDAAGLESQAAGLSSAARSMRRSANLQLGSSLLAGAAGGLSSYTGGASLLKSGLTGLNIADTASGYLGSLTPWGVTTQRDWQRDFLYYALGRPTITPSASASGAAGANYTPRW